VLRRSEQAYCQWQRRRRTRIELEQAVLEAVKQLRIRLPCLGTRKLHAMLRNWGPSFALGRDKLFGLLRAQGLLVPHKKVFQPTTRGIRKARYPNLSFTPTSIERLWVSDITFLRLGYSWRYLALVMDRYSRRIVGYHIADKLTSVLALEALRQALATRTTQNLLVHHSDRGSQYHSDAFAQLMRHHGVIGSMTQRPDPYENAHIERVIGILKYELALAQTFRCEQQLINQVHYAIHAYNCLRPHNAIHGKTPLQAHSSSSEN
jgi:putative transposase